jgi:hypothetical protein
MTTLTATKDVATEPGTSIIEIMDPSGDTKLRWDRNNRHEVENARRTFNDLRSKGFVAYSVPASKRDQGEVLNTFDETAERIVMAPAMQGG